MDMRPQDWLLFSAIMTFAYVWVCFWTFITTVGKRKQLREIADNLGGQIRNSLTLEPVLELSLFGFPIRAIVTCPTKRSQSFLRISLNFVCLTRLIVIPKRALELIRGDVSLLFRKKINSGFDDLDRKLSFYGASESIVREYLKDERVRNVLIELFNEGWTRLEFGNNGIRLSRELTVNKFFGFAHEPHQALELIRMKKDFEWLSFLAQTMTITCVLPDTR